MRPTAERPESMKIRKVRVAEAVALVFMSYITGARVPSDHLPTGTKKRVSGSRSSRVSKATGDPGRFAPQLAPAVFGRWNIKWGNQCTTASLRYCSFDIM